jgi:predicted nuclease of predicted toxin-antitoxin system
VRFLVDEQLPASVAQWLAGRGHEAQHVGSLGMKSASDQTVWSHALATDAVIVTKDRDFVEWAIARRPAAVVLWLRFGNLKRTILLRRLENAWPKILEGLVSGARVVEAGP